MEIQRTTKFFRHPLGYQVIDGLLTPKLNREEQLALTPQKELVSERQPTDQVAYDLAGDAYQQFAAIADERGVIRFANRHGLVGLSEVAKWKNKTTDKDRQFSTRLHGERVADWLTEAGALRLALERYRDAVDGEDVLALMDVGELVNLRLRRFPAPLLRVEGDRLAWRVEAPNLLAELWSQFASTLVGGITVRTCICGKLIVSERKLNCSPTCRVRASLARTELKKLKKQRGMTVAKMAAKLRVSPQWVLKNS
jgi:hypothetical protein